MRPWVAIAALAFLAGSAATAAAQRPGASHWPRPLSTSASWPQSQLSASLRPVAAGPVHFPPVLFSVDSTAIPPTHWLAGAVLGAGFLGLLGAAIGVQLSCYDGPCHNRLVGALGGVAFGGVVGFGLGALIGGQVPAPPR